MKIVVALVFLGGLCGFAHGQIYEAERMPSQTGGFFYNDRTAGEFVGAGREAIKGVHRPGFLAYGPYVRLPKPKSGYYWIEFKFRMSQAAVGKSPFVTFEVYDATARQFLASTTYTLSASPRSFGVARLYVGRPNPANLLEFRTYWHGNANARIDRVRVQLLNLRP